MLQSSKEELKNLGVNQIIYIDADADDTQDFCDKHNVDRLPHVKVYKDDKCIANKIGDGAKNIVNIIKNAQEKKTKTIFDITKK